MWRIDTFHNFRKIRHAAFYAKKYHLAPWRELGIDPKPIYKLTHRKHQSPRTKNDRIYFIHLLPRIAKRLYATQSQLPHIRPKYTCAFHISIGRFIHLLPRIAKRLCATQSNFRTSDPKISAPRTYQMTIQKLTKY